MIYRILADVTLAVHFAFILFVVLGGLLVAWRSWIAWFHLPTALWGALITLIGWTCPLTPLENHLRRLGGEAGYSDSFIEHYLLSLIYPQGVSQTGWILLGVSVVAVNLLVYGWVYRRRQREGRTTTSQIGTRRSDGGQEVLEVARFRHRHEAEMARGFLQDAEIPSSVIADDAGEIQFGKSFSRPARLLVRGEEVEAARAVLKRVGIGGLPPP